MKWLLSTLLALIASAVGAAQPSLSFIPVAGGSTVNTDLSNITYSTTAEAIGAITTWNVTLPANPQNGQTIVLGCPGGNVAVIKVTAAIPLSGPNFSSCSNSPPSFSATYQYSSTYNAWYRIDGGPGPPATATSYYFSNSTGNDANNCTSSSTPCQTLAKFQSLLYKGGDSIFFLANDTWTILPTFGTGGGFGLIGPNTGISANQNFFPNANTITISTYGGGTCAVIAGTTSGCASFNLPPNSPVTVMLALYNANNVVVNNLRFDGSNAAAYSTPGGTIGVYVRSNGNSVITATVTNVEVINAVQGIYYNDGNGTSPYNATVTNNYYRLHPGAPANFIQWTSSLYTTLAAFQAATSKDAGSIATTPAFSGTPGSGGTCYTSGIPAGPQPCPAAYALNTGSGDIGVGTDLTQAPYSQNVGTRDYYGNTIPNGAGTGYNIGADGANH